MEVNIILVEKIIHYAPLYSALEALRNDREFLHIKVQMITTESDVNTLRLLSKEEEKIPKAAKMAASKNKPR